MESCRRLQSLLGAASTSAGACRRLGDAGPGPGILNLNQSETVFTVDKMCVELEMGGLPASSSGGFEPPEVEQRLE
jgi:hypothetical protein